MNRRLPPLILLLIVLAAGAYLLTQRSAPASADARAQQAALAYAKQYMVWQQGPTARTVYTGPMSGIRKPLEQVPASVRSDINLPGLLRRIHPNRRVQLVILRGVYNTLAPDEGVEMAGDVVVIVDARTNKVLFTMY